MTRTPTAPRQVRVNDEGSGTAVMRTLSRTQAEAVGENVTLAEVNGVVLRIPAKPPGKNGSGLAVYERDPSDTDPSKSSVVVAAGTVPLARIAYP